LLNILTKPEGAKHYLERLALQALHISGEVATATNTHMIQPKMRKKSNSPRVNPKTYRPAKKAQR